MEDLKKRFLFSVALSLIAALIILTGCEAKKLQNYKGSFCLYSTNINNEVFHKTICESIMKNGKPNFVVNLSGRKNIKDKNAYESAISSFNGKAELYTLEGNSKHFIKNFHDIHIAFLSIKKIISNNNMNEKDEIDWLVDDLKKYSKSKYKIIVMDEPYYTSFKNKKDTAKKIYAALEPVFRVYKVDLIINSGANAYERYEKNDLVDITTGFVGKDGNKLKSAKVNKNFSKMLEVNKLHYINVSNYGNGLKVEAISCGKIENGKLQNENKVIDTYTLIKK